MSRALVTFGVGPMEEILELALPGLVRYADRHGYILRVNPPAPDGPPRAASWWKIQAILHGLDSHDEVLWMDCDTVIIDDTDDLADQADGEAWHAISRHFTAEGEVPSCGVWLVRQPMRRVLHQMWRMTQYLEHPWWEQAALHELLGYGGRPVELVAPTDLYDRTCWFGEEWNRLCFDVPTGDETPAARILHIRPGWPMPARADLMRQLTARVPLAFERS